MKVERKEIEPKFEPVVITLESAYEVQKLFEVVGKFHLDPFAYTLYQRLLPILDSLKS